jgi:hypothetical protein
MKFTLSWLKDYLDIAAGLFGFGLVVKTLSTLSEGLS